MSRPSSPFGPARGPPQRRFSQQSMSSAGGGSLCSTAGGGSLSQHSSFGRSAHHQGCMDLAQRLGRLEYQNLEFNYITKNRFLKHAGTLQKRLSTMLAELDQEEEEQLVERAASGRLSCAQNESDHDRLEGDPPRPPRNSISRLNSAATVSAEAVTSSSQYFLPALILFNMAVLGVETDMKADRKLFSPVFFAFEVFFFVAFSAELIYRLRNEHGVKVGRRAGILSARLVSGVLGLFRNSVLYNAGIVGKIRAGVSAWGFGSGIGSSRRFTFLSFSGSAGAGKGSSAGGPRLSISSSVALSVGDAHAERARGRSASVDSAGTSGGRVVQAPSQAQRMAQLAASRRAVQQQGGCPGTSYHELPHLKLKANIQKQKPATSPSLVIDDDNCSDDLGRRSDDERRDDTPQNCSPAQSPQKRESTSEQHSKEDKPPSKERYVKQQRALLRRQSTQNMPRMLSRWSTNSQSSQQPDLRSQSSAFLSRGRSSLGHGGGEKHAKKHAKRDGFAHSGRSKSSNKASTNAGSSSFARSKSTVGGVRSKSSLSSTFLTLYDGRFDEWCSAAKEKMGRFFSGGSFCSKKREGEKRDVEKKEHHGAASSAAASARADAKVPVESTATKQFSCKGAWTVDVEGLDDCNEENCGSPERKNRIQKRFQVDHSASKSSHRSHRSSRSRHSTTSTSGRSSFFSQHSGNFLQKYAAFTKSVVLNGVLGGNFFSERSAWLVFDTVLLAASAVEIAATIFFTVKNSSLGAPLCMKILSALLLFRVFRIVKLLQYSEELLLVFKGLLVAFATIFWILVLLGIFIYVNALVLVRGFGHQCRDAGHQFAGRGVAGNGQWALFGFSDCGGPSKESQSLSQKRIGERFGTVQSAMYYLFVVFTLDTWPDIAEPFREEVGVTMGWYFVLFIMVTNFIVFSLVIAMALQNIKTIKNINDWKLLANLAKEKALVQRKLLLLFRSCYGRARW
eukprot:g10168.t1